MYRTVHSSYKEVEQESETDAEATVGLWAWLNWPSPCPVPLEKGNNIKGERLFKRSDIISEKEE
jgi:hypothetical protein